MLLALALYVPGVRSLPAIDRDESRFAQASRQMLASGDYVVPMVGTKPRLNKPPMIYWLQASSAWIGSRGDARHDAVWMYRVPSSLAAVLAMLITWRLGLSMFSPRTAWIAAVMLGLSPIVWWEARQARADEVLLFASAGALWCQWRLAVISGSGKPDPSSSARPLGRAGQWVVALWGFVALGTLTKGPITPLVVFAGATMRAAISRSWRPLREIRPFVGVLILAASFAPWIIAVGERVGWSKYLTLVRAETLGRASEAKEGHSGWPLYHATILPVLMFPGSLLLGTGVARAFGKLRQARGRDGLPMSPEGFLLCAILPSWLVFEIVSTKLPHYTMPLFPAVALLCARAVGSMRVRAWFHYRGVRLAVWTWIIGVGAFIVTVGGAGTWIAWTTISPAMGALTAGVVIAAWAWSSWLVIAAWRRRQPLAMLVGALPSVVTAFLCFAILLPSMPGWLARDVVTGVAEIDPQGIRPIADVHFREDSVILGTHGRTQHIEDKDLAAWVKTHPNGLVLLDAKHVPEWPRFAALREVSGVNYSNGRRQTVVIGEFRSSPSEPNSPEIIPEYQRNSPDE